MLGVSARALGDATSTIDHRSTTLAACDRVYGQLIEKESEIETQMRLNLNLWREKKPDNSISTCVAIGAGVAIVAIVTRQFNCLRTAVDVSFSSLRCDASTLPSAPSHALNSRRQVASTRISPFFSRIRRRNYDASTGKKCERNKIILLFVWNPFGTNRPEKSIRTEEHAMRFNGPSGAGERVG